MTSDPPGTNRGIGDAEDLRDAELLLAVEGEPDHAEPVALSAVGLSADERVESGSIPRNAFGDLHVGLLAGSPSSPIATDRAIP